jgi:hypothetical protein
MRPARPWIRLAGTTVFSVIALIATAAIALFFFYDDRTITRFDSPSGKWRFLVAEGCLGHACAHSAYLEDRSQFWVTRHECHFLLIGDSVAFEQGSVIWNADETALEWYTPTFNVGGRIDFAKDCARK